MATLGAVTKPQLMMEGTVLLGASSTPQNTARSRIPGLGPGMGLVTGNEDGEQPAFTGPLLPHHLMEMVMAIECPGAPLLPPPSLWPAGSFSPKSPLFCHPATLSSVPLPLHSVACRVLQMFPPSSLLPLPQKSLKHSDN